MVENELQSMMNDLDKKYEILQGDKECKIKYINNNIKNKI